MPLASGIRTVLAIACRGPGPCDHPAVVAGLCSAHYLQLRRTGSMKPLRDPTQPPKVGVAFRVTQSCRDAVHANPSGAREALEAWAEKNPAKK